MPFTPPGRGGCVQHHLIWFQPPHTAATVAIGCAHCPHITARLDLATTSTTDDIDRITTASRDQHTRLCDRKRRTQPSDKGKKKR